MGKRPILGVYKPAFLRAGGQVRVFWPFCGPLGALKTGLFVAPLGTRAGRTIWVCRKAKFHKLHISAFVRHFPSYA